MWSKDRITILKSHIVLVGMPGSGKSLTGKKLASRLNVPFFDTDTEIEKRVNMSIPNIFKYKGESFFRNYEEKIIKELLLKDVYSVISTGGGAFVSKISRDRIKSKAISIWINVDLNIIFERIQFKKNRPLLENSDNKRKYLQKTFNIRYPMYKSADIKINNNNIPIQYVIDYIVDLIDNYYKKKQFFKVMNNIVPVELGKRSYNINISDKLQNINIKSDVDKVFILTDDIVSKIYLQQIESSITQNNKKLLCQSIIIENGEQSKNIIKAGEVIEEILSYKPTRKSILIALGGGVVGDITGFVASTILRGINFIQIPTTLLSQVDSSVGGKTGVNSKYGKNLIGAFHQPIAVYIYLDMLHSLNQREFNSGYAEVLKYAMIRKKDFFEQLNNNIDLIKQRDLKILTSIISTSCKTKATIVSEDEKESGNRALLNFGHTFGHAIEGALQYNKEVINHGEAVAIGMVMATAFSVYLKYCKIDVLNQLKAHLMSIGIATQLQDMNINISNEDLVKYMHSDKKKLGNNLTFILLNDLGDAFIAKNIADNVVLDFLNSELC